MAVYQRRGLEHARHPRASVGRRRRRGGRQEGEASKQDSLHAEPPKPSFATVARRADYGPFVEACFGDGVQPPAPRSRSCAVRASSSRKRGWASSISAAARSRSDLPLRSAQPNSVTTIWVSLRGVVTGPSSLGTIRETAPRAAVEWQAMIDRPWRAAQAPRTKSSWPPDALYWWPATHSELQAPSRSTCSVALTDSIRSLRAMIAGSFT